MATNRSENWDPGNSAQRYTVGFFNKQYGDDPAFIVASNERQNQELNYFNIADPDNDTAAEICAGLLIAYVEADSVPLHDGKDRGACLTALGSHLRIAQGRVLATADIVDEFFNFFSEVE